MRRGFMGEYVQVWPARVPEEGVEPLSEIH